MRKLTENEFFAIVGIWLTTTLSVVAIFGFLIEYRKAEVMKAWSKPAISISLPERCDKYYGVDSAKWQDCMGVAPK